MSLDLIQSILGGNKSEAAESFNREVMTRVSSLLDEKREVINQTLFNQKAMEEGFTAPNGSTGGDNTTYQGKHEAGGAPKNAGKKVERPEAVDIATRKSTSIIPDSTKKGNGHGKDIYDQYEEPLELEAAEQMKDDVAPIPDAAKKANGYSKKEFRTKEGNSAAS